MFLTLKTMALAFGFFCVFLASPQNVFSSKEILPGLTKEVFPNGLTAVVKENHSSRVTAVQIWVKAGSVYENSDEAGLTHQIEHMIFKGTATKGPGVLARTIESIGGSINAYTSLDYTVYHCVVPSEHTETAIDFLSDAVLNSRFDPDELEREKRVVLEEIRMRNDMPQSRLWNLLMATAYEVSPYRLPVIGTPESVKSFTREGIIKYMKRRYRPCQMSVIVAGDVDTPAVLQKIDSIFSVRAKEDPDIVHLAEDPVQKKPRFASETMKIEEGNLALAFSGIPDFNDPDTPVLDVIASILGDGYSSRLVYALKERDRLVHTIDASAFTPGGQGLFEVSATLEPGKTARAISGILTEVYRLISEPVLEEELERAKTKVLSDFVYRKETMEGEARQLGVFTTLSGNPAGNLLYIQRINAVRPEDIMKAAKRYFRPENVSVAMVMPEDNVPAVNEDTVGDMAAEIFGRTVADENVPSSSDYRVVPLHLPNGLTVLMKNSPENPTVSMTLAFPGGLRYETEKNNGIFNFMAQVWTRGTKKHTTLELAETIEGMGAGINGFSGQNSFGLKGRCLKDNLDDFLEVFSEILMEPAFPPDEIEKLKPVVAAAIKRENDNLTRVAIKNFKRLLYAPSPYSMDTLGTLETVSSFTPDELRSTMAQYAVPDRAVLAISGDIDTDTLSQKLQELLGNWQVKNAAIPKPPVEPDPLEKPEYSTVVKDKQQSHIILGFEGTSMSSPDRYALDVLNAVLAGQGGRLFSTLRDKESLAYSVTSFVSPGLEHGAFAFYIACAPDKKDRAQKSLWREIYRVRSKGVTPVEVQRAINWLSGREEIGLQTNNARAMDMAIHELYGLGYNFSEKYVEKIKKVTVEEVNAAAVKFITPERYVLVIVGP